MKSSRIGFLFILAVFAGTGMGFGETFNNTILSRVASPGDAGFLATSGNGNEIVTFGWSAGGFGYIQGGYWGGATKNLTLQAGGGNVGIGTTSPMSKLHITKTSDYSGNQGIYVEKHTIGLSPDSTTQIANSGTSIAFGNSYRNWTVASIFGAPEANSGYAGYLSFYTTDSGSSHLERMRINSQGNVGIGTTSPGAKLDIDFANNTWAIRGIRNGNPLFGIHANYDNPVTIESLGTRDLKFRTGSTDNSLYIKDNGTIGIGTTTTLGKLSIAVAPGDQSAIFIDGGNPTRITFNNTGNAIIGVNGIRNFIQMTQYQELIFDAAKFSFTGGGVIKMDGELTVKKIKVQQNVFADYVFKSGYNLRPLAEVENYIKENGHLPEIPSEKEVAKKGIDIGDMQVKLLAKVEELTLHLIAQEKKLAMLEAENTKLKAKVEKMEK